MKKEVFELALKFHLELIRATPRKETIGNAKAHLVDGDKRLAGVPYKYRVMALNFAYKILARVKDLELYSSVDWHDKAVIYRANNKRVPKQAVFNAVEQLNLTGCNVYQAATDNGVNSMCVKKLAERMKRYERYAEKLKKLL